MNIDNPADFKYGTIPCGDCGKKLPRYQDMSLLDEMPSIVDRIVCQDCANRRDAGRAESTKMQTLKKRFAEGITQRAFGEELREATFGGLDNAKCRTNQDAWNAAQRWDVEEQNNLFLHGKPGTGKTLLCRCVLRRQFTYGRSVAETNGRRLMKVSSRFDEGRGLFALWKSVDVLLLDDLDKVHATADGVDALWEVLDARNSTRRRTLVTANRTIGDVRTHLSQNGDSTTVVAALDRLNPLTTFHMQGGSLR